MENVEVKLFPAGMFVFGFYRNNHPYDTEQLWAAFFKMLLDKRLVPKIFLSNVSPAFEWIKQFVPRGEFQEYLFTYCRRVHMTLFWQRFVLFSNTLVLN
jgi:hypothetical protein